MSFFKLLRHRKIKKSVQNFAEHLSSDGKMMKKSLKIALNTSCKIENNRKKSLKRFRINGNKFIENFIFELKNFLK